MFLCLLTFYLIHLANYVLCLFFVAFIVCVFLSHFEVRPWFTSVCICCVSVFCEVSFRLFVVDYFVFSHFIVSTVACIFLFLSAQVVLDHFLYICCFSRAFCVTLKQSVGVHLSFIA